MTNVKTTVTTSKHIVLFGILALVLFAGCEGTRQYVCEDHGCLGHPARGEAAANGGNCSGGIACNVPGSNCVTNGTMVCKTWNMGGGTCTCACMQK